MQEYVVMLVLSWVNQDSDFTLSFDKIHIGKKDEQEIYMSKLNTIG